MLLFFFCSLPMVFFGGLICQSFVSVSGNCSFFPFASSLAFSVPPLVFGLSPRFVRSISRACVHLDLSVTDSLDASFALLLSRFLHILIFCEGVGFLFYRSFLFTFSFFCFLFLSFQLLSFSPSLLLFLFHFLLPACLPSSLFFCFSLPLSFLLALSFFFFSAASFFVLDVESPLELSNAIFPSPIWVFTLGFFSFYSLLFALYSLLFIFLFSTPIHVVLIFVRFFACSMKSVRNE